MSLRFVFGPSGSGKSYQVYQEVIRRSMENPKQNFLVVVPDQFTMQTQKDLVSMHERGGIMNIDVLSFGRLTHRILEEVGGEDIPVLDDTGKSLVLQLVAASLKEKMPILGGQLHKQGYIHEVKSALSEFMQYGIGMDELDQLIEYAKSRGVLYYKLKDLKVIYQGFKEYIQGNFITTEEKLDVLRNRLQYSNVLKGSVVVFDGFTGFTPIQNRLIQEIMTLAEEVIVTLTMGDGENPYVMDGEQKLFHLSKKTVADLTALAEKAGVSRGQDITIGGEVSPRFGEKKALHSLEQNLFRMVAKSYGEPQDCIHLWELPSSKEEVHQCGLKILELVREGNLQYRDIAVITGNMGEYAPFVETEFADMGIPVFLDQTRGIVLNPMIEFIKSALQLYIKDFSYEAVFHYMRCGLVDFTHEEIDYLEEYVLQTGIRGKRKWALEFTRKTKDMGEEEDKLLLLNDIRRRFMEQLVLLEGKSKDSAKAYVEKLYAFLVDNQTWQKLKAMESMFEEQGELAKAKEYGQIYRLIMDLLDQVYSLLGEEEITLQEFLDILVAGFAEIQVGTIPQNVDRVVVGDMERTRLKQVKVLFFLGINDGNIPKSGSKGGIISDIDREFLSQSSMELSPTPRQQMYIQRLYLYLNMTKPSEALYLSYAKVDREGTTHRPAYLVDTVKKLFPYLAEKHPSARPILEQVVTKKEGLSYLALGLREFVARGGNVELDESLLSSTEGYLSKEDFYALYGAYAKEEDPKLLELLSKAAFARYQNSPLSKMVARALYGQKLENSVSRLETFASCAYRHFLQYGLSLQERQEFGFETVDMGNVFHGVLDAFGKKLEESKYTWFNFPERFAEETVEQALEQIAVEYGASILYSNARNEYAIKRMKRIMNRTVITLQNHIQKGEFTPASYEMSFRFTDNLESVNVALSEEETMRLRGRIDRVDIADDGEKVYVKIIDYKSGDKNFDLAMLYYGLQLQLVVYMNAAMEIEAKKHPDKEIVPAAILYYHMMDPTIETPVELSTEEINEKILESLRMNGIVQEDPTVVDLLDKELSSKSMVIPVKKNKDGSLAKNSSTMSAEDLQTISSYVNQKIRSLGKQIVDGTVDCNPYEQGDKGSCNHCPYSKVCGFDAMIPGYKKRRLPSLDKDVAMAKMREEVE